MLILMRRQRESVKIGSTVTVTVLGIKGNQIRLGIHAPREIEVHRKEVFERVIARRTRRVGRSQRKLEE